MGEGSCLGCRRRAGLIDPAVVLLWLRRAGSVGCRLCPLSACPVRSVEVSIFICAGPAAARCGRATAAAALAGSTVPADTLVLVTVRRDTAVDYWAGVPPGIARADRGVVVPSGLRSALGNGASRQFLERVIRDIVHAGF
jgi:hypothetical protein